MIAIFLLCIMARIVSGKLTCLDEHGAPVDMFVIYKLPEIIWYPVPHVVEAGKGYVYLDSNNKTFRFGDNSIGNEDNPAGRTLNQVYKKHFYFHQQIKLNTNRPPTGDIEDMAHIFYNDANPEGHEFFSNGHTKGALAFDKESGFWLISSVPRYPNEVKDGYGYPKTGCKFAQMMLCITFDSNLFDKIGLQLRFNNPHIHDAHLPNAWKNDYPNLDRVIKGENINEPPYENIIDLHSQGGVRYQHFAKAAGFGKDLYYSLVAPHLQCNLLTETWQHGRNIGPSCHGSYSVVDVLTLNITLPDEHFSFKNLNDHSKFAIGDSDEMPYVCIGDINRQPGQFHRGGGTMCVHDIELWKQFRHLVLQSTSCDKDEL